MKYYSRKVTRREKVNSFGRLGYVSYVEFFKTNNDKIVEKFNKGKKIRFAEIFLFFHATKIRHLLLYDDVILQVNNNPTMP